jgi:hypothetical protein
MNYPTIKIERKGISTLWLYEVDFVYLGMKKEIEGCNNDYIAVLSMVQTKSEILEQCRAW